jgi:hypothetical protein
MNRSLRGAFALAVALLLPAFALAATLTATDANSAWAQYKAAQDGDVVVLKGGAYGPLDLWTGSTKKVTITVAPGETVTATELYLDGDQNLTLDACAGTLDVAMPAGTQYGVSLQGTVNVTVKCVSVHAFDSASFIGEAVWIRNAKSTSFLNGVISWSWGGIGVMDSDAAILCGNTIHDINVDGIDLAGTTNSIACNNKVFNSHPDITQGDHPDCIQVHQNGTLGPTSNLKITGNLCYRGTGAAAQGIFIEDGDRLDVEDNAMFGPMANGLGFARSTNVTATHNYLQPLNLPDDTGTRIILRQQMNNAVVLNNAAPFVVVGGLAGEPDPTNVTPLSQQKTTITTAAAPGDFAQYIAWRTATGAGATPAPSDPTVGAAPAPPPVVIPPPGSSGSTAMPPPAPIVTPAVDPLQPALDAANAQITTLTNKLSADDASLAAAQAQVTTLNASVASLKAKTAKAQAALLAYPSNTAKQLQTKIANALAALK